MRRPGDASAAAASRGAPGGAARAPRRAGRQGLRPPRVRDGRAGLRGPGQDQACRARGRVQLPGAHPARVGAGGQPGGDGRLLRPALGWSWRRTARPPCRPSWPPASWPAALHGASPWPPSASCGPTRAFGFPRLLMANELVDETGIRRGWRASSPPIPASRRTATWTAPTAWPSSYRVLSARPGRAQAPGPGGDRPGAGPARLPDR